MGSTTGRQIGRNDPCPCKSGRKYKQCCLEKDEAAASAARAKAAEQAAKKAAESAGKTDDKQAGAPSKGAVPVRGRKPEAHQSWRKGAAQGHPTQRKSLPRKTGGG